MGSVTTNSDVVGRILPHVPTGKKAFERKKICIVSRAPFIGGAELAADRLGHGLRDAGHEVIEYRRENEELATSRNASKPAACAA